MIEINLLPDVKRELLKTERMHSMVLSLSVLVGIVSVGLVVLLAVWVYGVQTARSVILDNSIKSDSAKLSNVEDLSDALTIQNQLSLLSTMHNTKHVSSRVFDVLSTINPPEPNNISISKLSVDMDKKLVTVSAQATNGYPALDTFKKTIVATSFAYTEKSQKKSVILASGLIDSDRSYGEDATGRKVLRFTLSFTYPKQIFDSTLTSTAIVAPTKTNATDSYLGVPQSLFVEKAGDTNGGSQ